MKGIKEKAMKLSDNTNLIFHELPLFARFIKNNFLNEFVIEQLRLSQELKLPMLSYLKSMTTEELIAASKLSSTDFLTCLEENKASERIVKAQLRWVENKIGFLKSDEITAEDITLVSYIQKQSFLKLLISYTSIPEKIIALVQELDQYYLEVEKASTNTYINILKNRLGARESQLLEAQALSHVGNWVWDFENKKLVWTDELYRIYGLPPQSEITNTEIATYNHPDDAEYVKQQMAEANANDGRSDFIYRIILKDGTIKYLHARGQTQKDSKGHITKIVGTLQDITKQKLIENELKENQKFIQKIADTAPSIISVYNANTGNYVFINAAIKDLLGYDRNYILENGISLMRKLIHPDDLKLLIDENNKILNETTWESDESVKDYKCRIKNANDEYRWLHTYVTVFSRDAAGHPELMLNISIDITGKMEAEQILFQKNIELQQSNTNLEEFAYIASHDLKEPLRKISILGDKLLITQQEALNENGKSYLTKMIDSSQRMQTMINDLLSVSTITGDRAFENCSLQLILNEALLTLEYKIESQKAVIQSDHLPEAMINVPQFRQLFQNLLSNSLKFSKKEIAPKITVEHKYLTAKQVKAFDMIVANRYLQLKFTDNGIGFENEYSNKIFSIFKRLHSKSEYEGTGIGLSICKKIIENHNGVIFALGKPGVGATFTIILPIN
jgi:PAS domain S-box-containing protein